MTRPDYIRFGNLSRFSNISHFITTRGNKLKDGNNFSSFNLCDYTGDDPLNVLQARECMALELGIPVSRLVFPHQVHGTQIAVVDNPEGAAGDYDALITCRRGICIGISTADCVPILLYSPDRNVVAAVHAGWRGTVAHIAALTVRRMSELFGCDARNIVAGIGPSISVANFEVGIEVKEAFDKAGFHDVCVSSSVPGKAYIDLWESNRQDMLSAGLSAENIEIAGICTYGEYLRFFSARRLGIRSGRIASGIMLR